MKIADLNMHPYEVVEYSFLKALKTFGRAPSTISMGSKFYRQLCMNLGDIVPTDKFDFTYKIFTEEEIYLLEVKLDKTLETNKAVFIGTPCEIFLQR